MLISRESDFAIFLNRAFDSMLYSKETMTRKKLRAVTYTRIRQRIINRRTVRSRWPIAICWIWCVYNRTASIHRHSCLRRRTAGRRIPQCCQEIPRALVFNQGTSGFHRILWNSRLVTPYLRKEAARVYSCWTNNLRQTPLFVAQILDIAHYSMPRYFIHGQSAGHRSSADTTMLSEYPIDFRTWGKEMDMSQPVTPWPHIVYPMPLQSVHVLAQF